MEYFTPFVSSLLASASTIAILGVIGFICRSWLIERLKASIKHEYDLKMIEVERQKEIRLKAEIVSELLAEWIRSASNLDYNQLNKLSFQAYLWLPKQLAEDLSNSLSHKKGSKDVRLLLKEIRTYLQNSDDGLESRHVIVFEEPDIHGSMFQSNAVTSQAKVKPTPRR